MCGDKLPAQQPYASSPSSPTLLTSPDPNKSTPQHNRSKSSRSSVESTQSEARSTAPRQSLSDVSDNPTHDEPSEPSLKEMEGSGGGSCWSPSPRSGIETEFSAAGLHSPLFQMHRDQQNSLFQSQNFSLESSIDILRISCGEGGKTRQSRSHSPT